MAGCKLSESICINNKPIKTFKYCCFCQSKITVRGINTKDTGLANIPTATHENRRMMNEKYLLKKSFTVG